MSDEKRIDLSNERTCSTLVHLRGYYGDDGENESVLAVSARLDDSPMFPDIGRVIVGSPAQSPLLDGYLAKLGGFCCSPDAADRLADELKAAAAAARAEMAKGRQP